MSLIFDTGSTWLWIQSANCENCMNSNLYKSDQSLSFNYLGNQPHNVQYGSGSVWGYEVMDQLCIDRGRINTCITNFRFLSVELTKGLESLKSDGVLGLAPSSQDTTSDQFVERLMKDGIIKERMFSFNLGGTNEESKIIFGGYDMRFAGENKTITWNSLVNTHYWTLQLRQASFGELRIRLSTNEVIIDTGTSYIMMPQSEFNQIKRALEEQFSCDIDQGKTNLFYCTCLTLSYSDFPSLNVKIGDNTYSVPSTTYMKKENFRCYFRFVPQAFEGKGFWILGDTFLLNYYTIFDQEQQRIGFVGSVHIDEITYWREALLVLSICLALYGFVSLLYGCYLDRRKRSQQTFQVSESEMTDFRQIASTDNQSGTYQQPQLNL